MTVDSKRGTLAGFTVISGLLSLTSSMVTVTRVDEVCSIVPLSAHTDQKQNIIIMTTHPEIKALTNGIYSECIGGWSFLKVIEWSCAGVIASSRGDNSSHLINGKISCVTYRVAYDAITIAISISCPHLHTC